MKILKKLTIVVILVMIMCGHYQHFISEPAHCSLCFDLPRHALCIINLSTGEKVELDMYDPHPTLVGEIADNQPGGSFSLIRSAGVSGYKIEADHIEITVPKNSGRLNLRHFCKLCRSRLSAHSKSGYVLVDLKNPDNPIIYPINSSTSISVRCYYASIQENIQDNKYLLTILGLHQK